MVGWTFWWRARLRRAVYARSGETTAFRFQRRRSISPQYHRYRLGWTIMTTTAASISYSLPRDALKFGEMMALVSQISTRYSRARTVIREILFPGQIMITMAISISSLKIG